MVQIWFQNMATPGTTPASSLRTEDEYSFLQGKILSRFIGVICFLKLKVDLFGN